MNWLLILKVTILVTWQALEFWLGRTDKVKAGSVPEAILNGLEYGVLAIITGLVFFGIKLLIRLEKKNE